MTRPFIGITCGEIYNRDRPYEHITYGQTFTYCDAVVRAGGIPIILPIVDDETVAKETYDRLDGILFAGGNDIHPSLYGQQPHPKLGKTSQRRDTHEFRLMTWATTDAKPIFGVCRGMQMLNIVKGGDLYQDLQSDLPGATLDHTASEKAKTIDEMPSDHIIQINPGTQLYSIVKSDTMKANAFHHQAIKTIGQGIVVNAVASDGIIEGIEFPDLPFAFGFQCHPESLESEAEPKWQLLFQSFIDASTKSAS